MTIKKTNRIKKSASALGLTAMLLTGATGTAWAAVVNFGNIQPSAQTSTRASKGGEHRIKTSDCAGPADFQLKVDKANAFDPVEGSNRALCNGGSATVFGLIDSRVSPYRGHYLKNTSTQRVDYNWTYPG